MVLRLLYLGVDENDLGDTIGVAVPSDIERLFDALDDKLEPADTTLHLHDTRGTALVCVYRAMQLGVSSFDSSCAGLGGCPYAPGATGNLATEDLLYLCEQMNISTGVDRELLYEAGRVIARRLGRDGSHGATSMPGRVFCAEALDPFGGSGSG